jgi:hypothetical protein
MNAKQEGMIIVRVVQGDLEVACRNGARAAWNLLKNWVNLDA